MKIEVGPAALLSSPAHPSCWFLEVTDFANSRFLFWSHDSAHTYAWCWSTYRHWRVGQTYHRLKKPCREPPSSRHGGPSIPFKITISLSQGLVECRTWGRAVQHSFVFSHSNLSRFAHTFLFFFLTQSFLIKHKLYVLLVAQRIAAYERRTAISSRCWPKKWCKYSTAKRNLRRK